jgi:hypothetical protein
MRVSRVTRKARPKRIADLSKDVTLDSLFVRHPSSRASQNARLSSSLPVRLSQFDDFARTALALKSPLRSRSAAQSFATPAKIECKPNARDNNR